MPAEANLRRYRAYVLVAPIAPFLLPVVVLFWQENGLDLFDAFVLQAVFAVAVVVLEVPTGLFALGQQAVRGGAVPILSARILEYAYADKRATVLSIASLAGRLFFAATGPLVGLAARRAPLPEVLLGQAAVLAVLFAALLAARGRIPGKYFAVKGAVRERQRT